MRNAKPTRGHLQQHFFFFIEPLPAQWFPGVPLRARCVRVRVRVRVRVKVGVRIRVRVRVRARVRAMVGAMTSK